MDEGGLALFCKSSWDGRKPPRHEVDASLEFRARSNISLDVWTSAVCSCLACVSVDGIEDESVIAVHGTKAERVIGELERCTAWAS